MIQLAKGDAAAAEAAFRKAVEVGPKSAQAHLGLGNFLWSANRRDEAVQSSTRPSRSNRRIPSPIG